MSAAPVIDPRNRDFVWVDRSGPSRLLTPQQVRAFDEQGFVVIEDAFDADTVAGLVADLDEAERATDAFLRTRPDGRLFIARADEITFSPHLVNRSERARAFTRGKFFQDLVHALIGPNVRLYWDQAVYKKPGTEVPFPWHQDNGYTFVEPQQYVTCWVALTDAAVETGCPWIVPGLHRGGTLRHEMTDLGWECFAEPPAPPVAAPVRAGGVVVFSSLSPHKTGPNRSADHVRKAYIVQFAPDGAQVLESVEGRTVRTSCDAADRQYPVLIDGKAPA